MRIVISDEETIPEWLYPGTWNDLSTPAEDSVSAALEEHEWAQLWRSLAPDAEHAAALVPQSFDDVGIPHDAPDHVYRLDDDLVAAICAIPAHERWQVAQRWATPASGQRPNKEKLAAAKSLFNKLCELATRARATNRMLVVL